MKKLIIFILLTCCVCAQAAIAPAKMREILRLMDYLGDASLFSQMRDSQIEAMQKNLPDVPPSAWARFREYVSKEDFLQGLAKCYDAELTLDDLLVVNGMYSTDAKREVLLRIHKVAQTKPSADALKAEVSKLRDQFGADAMDPILAAVRSENFKRFDAKAPIFRAKKIELIDTLFKKAIQRMSGRPVEPPNQTVEPPPAAAAPPAAQEPRQP